jgi:hypothetical protein
MRRDNIFTAQKNIRFGHLQRVADNNHRFNQLMRQLLHQQAIFEGAWLHFIRIAHQIFLLRRALTHRHQRPLNARGETGAAATAQIGVFHQLLQILRRHLFHYFTQCSKTFQTFVSWQI